MHKTETSQHHTVVNVTSLQSRGSSTTTSTTSPNSNIITTTTSTITSTIRSPSHRSSSTPTSSNNYFKYLALTIAEFCKDGIISLLGFIKSNANLRSILLLFLNIIGTGIFQFVWSRLFISSEFTMLNNSLRGFDGSLGVEFLQHIGTRGRYLHLLYELIDLLYFIPSVSIFISCILYSIFSSVNKSLANVMCLSPIVHVIFGVLEHLNTISATFHYDFFSPMKVTRDYLTKASFWCHYKWISFGILLVITVIGVFCYLCAILCSGDCLDLSASNYYYRGVNQDEDSDEEFEISATDDVLGHATYDSK